MNSNITNANNLMKKGLYVEALNAYKQIKTSDPFWIDKIDANIILARNKIASIKKNEALNKEMKLDKLIMQSNQLTKKDSQILPAIYLEDIFKQIENENVIINLHQVPLVTIAMTAHNTEDYIESSIHSLLNQSYKNIEIIVVDDKSTDNTLEILKRLSKTDKRLKYKQFASNLGTYYAKNYAISIAAGEYIFFQDSDDICHPRRIEIMLDQLLKSGKKIIRGAYCRLDPNTNRIMLVNGLKSKLGLITLGIKKEIFKEIGYFHCTTKASDDEFFVRACKFLGKSQIDNNTLPLYYNTYREDSLFADMVTLTSEGDITQKLSISRNKYLENFTEIHAKYDSAEKIQRLFRFPQIRNSIAVLQDMTKLANPTSLVIYNVCSIPNRVNALKKTINSIIDQCDQINIYLDGYDATPDFLLKHANKCNVVHAEPSRSLRDNGKFIALENIITEGKSAYYFTIDDDIYYPPDYTNHLIKKIAEYNHLSVVGVHGVIIKDNPNGYFSDRRIVYGFDKALELDKAVNIIGTGTAAFHTSIINKFSIGNLPETGMADILFAIFCKQNKINQISISRPEKWLIDLNPTPGRNLYDEYKDNDTKQASFIKNNSPWGYTSIIESISAVTKEHEASSKYYSLTPRFKSLMKA